MKMLSHSKTNLPLFVMHWSWVIAFLICFTTGIRIASDHMPWLKQTSLSNLLPTPNPVFDWHLFGGSILLFSLTGYFAYLCLHNNLYKLWPYKKLPSGRITLSIPVLMHFIGIALLLIMMITGIINYYEVKNLSSEIVRLIHLSIAFFILLYIFLHIAVHFLYGGLALAIRMFFFKTQHLGYGPLSLFISIVITIALYSSTKFLAIDLPVHEIEQSPVIDGKADDIAWNNIKPELIANKHGNSETLLTNIEIRSVKDKNNIYFLIRWPDKDKSLTHTPLLKTKSGWKPLEKGFYSNNETQWYEDKLALMIATDPFAAIKSIHLSNQPITNAPGPLNKRGFHFTQDNSVLDIWHWKAWRTNSLFRAEDSYFSTPLIPRSCDRRYTAGYHSDPALSKGYKVNWSFYDGQTVVPKRIPKSSQFSYFNYSDQDPKEIALFPGVRWDDTFKYTIATDQLSINSLIPATMTTGPIRGDRGDVRAKGSWDNGYWTLEMSRILDTGSKYDIAIEDGLYVWISAFNHAQTKHSYHLRPLRLVIR